MDPYEELTTTVRQLRCEHSHPCQPPEGTLFEPGPCKHCGTPWVVTTAQGMSEPLRAELAKLLESAAWWTKTRGMADRHALNVARVINGKTALR
ncbi:hypothetical protein GCM10010156_66180 [Planobispora rosea]|uniref:Uncharacterized protein n=1 Tax=Planobispora rosea TaxID=35762 RepID=A0A8J3S4Z9_PLARO|nr:hypothetical protein [Planobispora rosea]GGS98818.1 hypothetical protein GCM10010156_66180 [Planobispora rosea]GIH87982.1 hypothetical protein Pro02_63900 [Planobispora rosea]